MQPGNLLSRTAVLCSLVGYLRKGGTWVIITGLLDDAPLLARDSHPISSSHFPHHYQSYTAAIFAAVNFSLLARLTHWPVSHDKTKHLFAWIYFGSQPRGYSIDSVHVTVLVPFFLHVVPRNQQKTLKKSMRLDRKSVV